MFAFYENSHENQQDFILETQINYLCGMKRKAASFYSVREHHTSQRND
jgi:hypothetical protein